MGKADGKVFDKLRRRLDEQRNKRDEYNLKVKEVSGSLTLLKERRDSLNTEVAKLKALRNAKQDEAMAIMEQAKAVGEKIRKSGVPERSFLELKSVVEKLEFDYETKPMSFQNEKKAVQNIEAAKRQLGRREKLEAEIRNLRDLERKIGGLKSEAQMAHDKMIGLVKQSEKVHDDMAGYKNQFSGLRSTANEAHKKVLAASAEVQTMRAELVGERDREMKQLFETKAILEKEREDATRHQAEDLEKELKTRKKFNIRELQILQHVGKDAAFIRKATRSEKEEKA